MDETDTPVFLNGEGAWGLMTALTYASADTYLTSCESHGINFLQVMAITRKFTTNAPANAYNVKPFASTAFSDMTEAYWKHIDSVIGLAKTKGVYVMLYPAYLGYDDTDGWRDSLTAYSYATIREYGKFLGSRYKDSTNVLWGAGGDAQPDNWEVKFDTLIWGIQQYDSIHLIMPRNASNTFGVDGWDDQSWITMNGYFPYWGTFSVWLCYQDAKTARERTPKLPAILQEARYENENSATQVGLRQQMYYSVLGGSTAGQVFGNCPIWHFSQWDASLCGTGNWVAELDSPGRTSLKWFGSLIRARNWWKFVPDTDNVVVTAGYGDWGQENYVTTAYTTDSSTILAYMPTNREITVNTNYISSGDSVLASWYDPVDGDSIYIGTYARTSSQAFTPSGSQDWVLVLNAKGEEVPATYIRRVITRR